MAEAKSIKYLYIALLMVGIAGQTGTLSAQGVTHLNPVIEKLAAGKPFIGFQTGNLSSENARTMARGQYWIHPALAEVVENALLGLPL